MIINESYSDGLRMYKASFTDYKGVEYSEIDADRKTAFKRLTMRCNKLGVFRA